MMLNKGDQIDDMIREALTKEEAEIFDSVFDEPSVFEMVTSVFRGKLRYLAVLMAVMILVFTAIAFFSLTRFVTTTDVPEMLRWGALLFFCLNTVWAMKIWHWMEMQRHALTREIKRLELQVANLSNGRSGD